MFQLRADGISTIMGTESMKKEQQEGARVLNELRSTIVPSRYRIFSVFQGSLPALITTVPCSSLEWLSST